MLTKIDNIDRLRQLGQDYLRMTKFQRAISLAYYDDETQRKIVICALRGLLDRVE